MGQEQCPKQTRKGITPAWVSSPGQRPTKSGRHFTAAPSYTIQTTTRALRRRPASRPSMKPTERSAIQPDGAPTTVHDGPPRLEGTEPNLAPFAGGGPSLTPICSHSG